MALIALTSAKGAPGVTTTALALTFAWHRPALLVEADMGAASSILAGYLKASIDHGKGLAELSLVHRHQPLSTEAVWDQVHRLAEGRYLLPGLADPVQAAGMTTTWAPLAELLTALDDAGIDVIIDAGRLGTAYGPTALLHHCDSVLLVTSSRLADLYPLSRRVRTLTDDDSRGSATRALPADLLRTLVVGEGRPYGRTEIEAAVTIPVLSAIAWDPINAEVFSSGATPGARFARSQFSLSITATATQVLALLEQRRRQLSPRPSPVQQTMLSGYFGKFDTRDPSGGAG